MPTLRDALRGVEDNPAATQLDAADDLANAADYLLRNRQGEGRWEKLRAVLEVYDRLRGDEAPGSSDSQPEV